MSKYEICCFYSPDSTVTVGIALPNFNPQVCNKLIKTYIKLRVSKNYVQINRQSTLFLKALFVLQGALLGSVEEV